MYRMIENNLDSILESMFEVNADDDLSVTIESFNSFIDDTVGMSYASEGKMADAFAKIGNVLANAVDAIIKFFHDLYESAKKFIQGLTNKHVALQNKIQASIKKANEKLEKDTNIMAAMKLAYTYDKEFNDKAVNEFTKICKEEADDVWNSSIDFYNVLNGLTLAKAKLSDDIPDSKAKIEESIKAINDAVKNLTKKKKEYREQIKEAIASKYPSVKPSQIGAMLTITTGAVKDINEIKETLELIAGIIKKNEDMAKTIKSRIKKDRFVDGSKHTWDDELDPDTEVTPRLEDAKAAVTKWKEVSKYFSKFVKVTFNACNTAVRGFTTSELTKDYNEGTFYYDRELKEGEPLPKGFSSNDVARTTSRK